MPRQEYRITVEHLGTDHISPDNAPQAGGASLQFTAFSHDEIIGLLERVGQRAPLQGDETAAMLTGLKLLGEVVMTHRQYAPFRDLQGALKDFIMVLKSGQPLDQPVVRGRQRAESESAGE